MKRSTFELGLIDKVYILLEGGNPNARHHGKGLERATFCHGVELSYCLVTVRALTQTHIF